MDRTYTRINWENEPSQNTPLNEDNLNRMDAAIYTIDGRVVGFDTTKADQSDLLQCVKQINYNTQTGVFLFTWQNGTTLTVDLNIEKIPVSFSMSPAGIITMTTADGTQYTADVSAALKTYTFQDSSVIDFTVTTDASGNKTVTANIVDGSITEDKLQPNFLADCEAAASEATTESLKSEGWAVGTQNGVPVTSGSPYYQNNAKYYKDQSQSVAYQQSDWNETDSTESAFINNKPFQNLDQNDFTVDTDGVLHANAQQIDELNDIGDVNITNPSDRQALVYDATNSEWVNGSGGLLPRMVIQTEVGSTVSITNGSETIIPEAQGMGIYYAELPDFDDWTVTATKDGQTAEVTVTVDTVKIYSVNASYFTAYISVTAPTGSTVTVVNGTETYTQTSGYNFTVHSSGTWNITVTKTDASKSGSVSITTDGQTASATFEFATITVNYASEFSGATITATDGTHTYTRVASGTVVFDIADFGTWTISATVSGQTYSSSVVVSANTSYTVSLVMASYQGWLDSAGITTQYASLAEVLADEKAVRTLFTKQASVDYLVSWAQIDNASATTILNNDYCAKWINLRDYALDTLYADTTCSALMDSADKYFYGEWVEKDGVWQAKGNVPIMTNNSTPYGVASAYQVFDGNTSTSASGTDFSYQFVNPISIKKFESDIADGTLQVSDDGTTWNTNDNGYHLYARVHYASSKTVHTIQFYGRELKVSVPTMTSNTAPWGEASDSSHLTNYESFKAFDGNDATWWNANGGAGEYIKYKFPTPVCVKQVFAKAYNNLTTKMGVFKIQGSNDNTVFTDIDTVDARNVGTITKNINNDVSYLYYRVVSVSDTTDYHFATLQFYGLDYSEHEERHYIYDHGVEFYEMSIDKGASASVTFEKRSSSIYVDKYNTGSGGNYIGGISSENIDTTDYTLERFVLCNSVYSGYGGIGLGTSASSDLGASAVVSSQTSNLPYNVFLDITSVNGNNKVCVGEFSSGSVAGMVEYNECWLE